MEQLANTNLLKLSAWIHRSDLLFNETTIEQITVLVKLRNIQKLNQILTFQFNGPTEFESITIYNFQNFKKR